MIPEQPVVLFDGICNYCNSMVNFAIRNDKKAVLRFATLQSDTGRKLKETYNIPPETDSVILIEKNKPFLYSGAALQIARHLRWPVKALYGFIIIPKFIREPVYKWIAKNRYKWFGKKERCMIPTPELRNRFLD